MRTLQIRSMPEDLHQELTRQASEKGVSLNHLLLDYLHDIAHINRHLTAQGKQAGSTQGPRRSERREGPSREEIVDTIRDLRGIR